MAKNEKFQQFLEAKKLLYFLERDTFYNKNDFLMEDPATKRYVVSPRKREDLEKISHKNIKAPKLQASVNDF